MPSDVLLASAPHADTFGYSMPPPGLLRLGGALERAGHAVRLEDLAYRMAAGDVAKDDDLARSCADLLLAAGAPRVALGLSCMGATLPAALAIAAEVKRREPQLAVWLGGPGTTDVETRLLERFEAIDAIGRGEGETTLVAMVARRAAGRDLEGVDGVSWRDARGHVRVEPDRAPLADLAELPAPAWHLLPPLAAYKAITGEDDGLVPIDSGRGCVYDCSFCSIGRTWKRRSRTLSAEHLLREVEEAMAMPGAKQVYLCHDIFGANKRNAIEVCAAFEARVDPNTLRPAIPFEVRARVDHLDDELIDAMGRAGCYRVLLGVETGDAELRNRHNKRMDTGLDVLDRIERLERAGVASILSLVLGLPGESDAELARTLDLCVDASLRAPVHLSLHLPNPQPGCELGARDEGASRPLDGIVPDMAWGAGDSAAERAIIDAHPDLFGTFAVLLEGGEARVRWLRELADQLPPVLMRYARTFALLSRRLGEDALGTYRAWRANGRSFESFALASGFDEVNDALRWEQAIVRESARGAANGESRAPLSSEHRTRATESNGSSAARVRCASVVRVRFDPTVDPRAWRDASPIVREARALAVIRADADGADEGGAVRTVGVSNEVADVLEALDGVRTDEVDAALLDALAERGLLARPTTNTAIAAEAASTATPSTR